ncbi:MAG: trypsin-like peptidase domain-containing protein [Bdellovibrionaceae bacterium]|nr:trypsin-like peptidase domain-containing protein [Pseudobdellovibrionaceae bacterium]
MIAFFSFIFTCQITLADIRIPTKEDYLYGDIWSRRFVEASDLQSPKYARSLFSAVRFGTGSGIYLGKFNHQHILATNKHVMDSSDCNFNSRRTVHFYGGIKGKGADCVAMFEELDLAFVSFTVAEQDEEKLKKVATNFAFDTVPTKGTKIFFFGYPSVENPLYEVMFGGDDDCRVISETGDIRFLNQPLSELLTPPKRWYFATACDMAKGDSGAALFDIDTGEAIGIVSSGHPPANVRYNSSAILNSDLLYDPEIAWKLNLSIPAIKMKAVIQQKLSEDEFSPSIKKTLTAILNNQPD